VEQVWAARGKKVLHFDFRKEKPDNEQLLKALLGPSGSLRAPAIRRGKKLFVGFHPDTYADHLT
jgi:arsenate reductase-like glutaredoxin family protein